MASKAKKTVAPKSKPASKPEAVQQPAPETQVEHPAPITPSGKSAAAKREEGLIAAYLKLFAQVSPDQALPVVRCTRGQFNIGDGAWLGDKSAFMLKLQELQTQLDAKAVQAEATPPAAEPETQSPSTDAPEDEGVQKMRAIGVGDPPEFSTGIIFPEETEALRILAEAQSGTCYIRHLMVGPAERMKHYAAYAAKQQGSDLQVVDATTGAIIATYLGRSTPKHPDRAAEIERRKQVRASTNGAAKPTTTTTPGAPRKRSVTNGELTGMAKDAFELAVSKSGAKRTALNALNKGVVINWKYYLSALGGKRGYDVRVDKNGETPVYFLEKTPPSA